MSDKAPCSVPRKRLGPDDAPARARELAANHCDEFIVDELVAYCGLEYLKAEALVARMKDEIRRLRGAFRNELVEWWVGVFRGEVVPKNVYQVTAAQQLSAFCLKGWKVTPAEAKPKAGGPRLVKAS